MTGLEGSALGDVRVLDLTTYVPGPYASHLLASLGASVLSVESPAGDPARHRPERIGKDSALHWWLSRHKNSITLDLKTPEGHERFREELAKTDIVLEGFAPGVAHKLNVDYDSCVAVNPNVVYCSLSGYGQDSAESGEPGHDINLCARAGLLDQAQGSDGGPATVGPLLADLSGSLHAAVAVLAALHHRERTGRGQYVDVSLFGSAVALVGPQLMKALAGSSPTPASDLNLGADPAYRLYPTRDGGHVAVGALEDKYWKGLCGLLGRTDLIEQRAESPRWVAAELGNIFSAHDREHWRSLLGSAKVCVSVVNTIDEVASDPWIRENHVVLAADDPSGFGPTVAGPIRMSLTPPRLTTPVVFSARGRRVST